MLHIEAHLKDGHHADNPFLTLKFLLRTSKVEDLIGYVDHKPSSKRTSDQAGQAGCGARYGVSTTRDPILNRMQHIISSSIARHTNCL